MFGCLSREMKKGNVGVVFEMLGKKLKDSMGRKIDYGLTGKDGVVHPSLTVSRFWCFTHEVPLLIFDNSLLNINLIHLNPHICIEM